MKINSVKININSADAKLHNIKLLFIHFYFAACRQNHGSGLM